MNNIDDVASSAWATCFPRMNGEQRGGLTLIELSIVLVIIGLLAGGVLVGQDLIRAAEIRATITQVEKFNTAKNTFYGKYGALPGDMNNGVALTFGFTSRSGLAGQGDGNGLLDGEGGAGNLYQCGGETGMFWSDMSYANGMNLNLIEGSFGSGVSPILTPTSTPSPAFSQLPLCFPAARLGGNNYFDVYEIGGYYYYSLALGSGLGGGQFSSLPGLRVLQAYTIDKKLDDGLPATGAVQTMFVNAIGVFASPNVSGTAYTPLTCFDAVANIYATDSTVNGNGTGGRCALSFRMQ